MKIKAFGKMVSREQAYQIIINDKISDICHARNTDMLEDLLMYGWVSLEEWTDKELEDYVSELLIENQPNGKI
ncbi:hypothetical protein KJ707_01740 [Patescibacteria group bacterium]|nr:hypothetical protein [Patescibacteria group bacterium]